MLMPYEFTLRYLSSRLETIEEQMKKENNSLNEADKTSITDEIESMLNGIKVGYAADGSLTFIPRHQDISYTITL